MTTLTILAALLIVVATIFVRQLLARRAKSGRVPEWAYFNIDGPPKETEPDGT